MGVKDFLRTNFLTKDLYVALQKLRVNRVRNAKLKYHGKFVNRSKGQDKLLIVLAGYKSFLYSAVFGRIEKFIPDGIDVCIVSSGLYSQQLEDLCAKNDWSYLSTKENNVCLVQNVAINLHTSAKYIYKLDEDIFITQGYFDKMFGAYRHAQQGEFTPGVIAPLIPINGYAHVKILQKLGLEQEYVSRFEPIKYMAGSPRQIETNPQVAKFFWGEGGFVPSIDEMNARFAQEPLQESACPIRFSIGAILFERSLWENMGYFTVNRKKSQMGEDEVQLCSYCLTVSRPLMVSENVVVGHLSFGPQNQEMKEYYLNNVTKFEIQ